MEESLAGGTISKMTNDCVLCLRLSRPDKRNALTGAMYDALRQALEEAQETASVRAVLLGTTNENFTAGNDIGEFAAAGKSLSTVADTPAISFVLSLARFSKPVVASVPGLAVGIGTTMLLHVDLAFTERETRLSAPFVGLGLSPEAGSSLLMPALIGPQRAFSLFALGKTISGEEAVSLGLALKCLDAGQSDATALGAARALAELPPAALRTTKRLLHPLENLEARIALESSLFAERLGSGEAAEAFRAFTEKRAPDFSRF